VARACHQCEPGCQGGTNTVCYACGSPVCRNCSRLLPDKTRKGAASRICLNCAEEWPERYGFRSKKADTAQPPDAAYYWAATEPAYAGKVKRVLARKIGEEVALALMGDEYDKYGGRLVQIPYVQPPYREFR